MADVINQKSGNVWRVFVLVGLTMLTVFFCWLTYQEILFLREAWRWQHNILVEFKIAFRIVLLVILTIGASVGPSVVIIRYVRGLTKNGRT